MIKKTVCTALICLLSISSLWALTGSASERAGKAAVSPSYPVTPGDAYSVSYSLSGEAFQVQMTVDKNYLAQVPGFGKFQTEGMSYYELKAQVEQLVNDVFPGSVPVMTISSS